MNQMEGILEQASTQLLQYGVLGVICILLIIGIAWLVLDQRRLTNERNAFYDEKLREIEESQKETFNVFSDTVVSFKQVAEDVRRQTDVLMGVRDQVNKMEWELGNLNQKVDRIQERQDRQMNK
nr:MAG TPA: protein of unknown function (DUF948) [Bacteriophage sp.]